MGLIKLPMQVEFMLNRLHDRGFSAYVVGGCVRDSFLGKVPNDWDITTSATPEQVENVFSDCTVIKTGIKHGTVSVVLKSETDEHLSVFEVTTFRIDGVYRDNRHPEFVEYTDDVVSDLSRRDFTINAMAYNSSEIIDPYNGKDDLDHKIVRCVGNPDDRFREDALRVIRAVRFALRLGYTIEEETFHAMRRNLVLVKNISKERVCDELTKILGDSSFPERRTKQYTELIGFLIDLIESLSFTPLNIDKPVLMKNLLDSQKGDILVRLALIFRNTDVVQNLKHFRFPNDIVFGVSATVFYGNRMLTRIPDYIMPKDRVLHFARKLLCEVKNHDADAICQYAIAKTEQFEENRHKNLDMIQKQVQICKDRNDVYSLQYLAVNGNDLLEIGFSGEQIGNTLSKLLDLVIYDQAENNRADLLREAGVMYENEQDRVYL